MISYRLLGLAVLWNVLSSWCRDDAVPRGLLLQWVDVAAGERRFPALDLVGSPGRVWISLSLCSMTLRVTFTFRALHDVIAWRHKIIMLKFGLWVYNRVVHQIIRYDVPVITACHYYVVPVSYCHQYPVFRRKCWNYFMAAFVNDRNIRDLTSILACFALKLL